MRVEFFDERIERFIAGLDTHAAAKVLRTIDLLERFGDQLGMPHSRSIGRRLFELRIRGKQEIRLLYAFREQGAVVLHGFVKKSGRMPRKEFRAAERRLMTLDVA